MPCALTLKYVSDCRSQTVAQAAMWYSCWQPLRATCRASRSDSSATASSTPQASNCRARLGLHHGAHVVTGVQQRANQVGPMNPFRL